MQTANLAGARRPPRDARGSRSAKAESEIDLERVIYDPVYRKQVRDELNRGESAPDRDKDK